MDERVQAARITLGADWLDCCRFLRFWKAMGLGRQNKHHHQPASPVLLAEATRQLSVLMPKKALPVLTALAVELKAFEPGDLRAP